MDDVRFELTYRLDPADYRAMMAAYWRLTPARKWRVRILQAFVVTGGLFCLYAAWTTRDPISIAFASLAAAGFVAIPWIGRWVYARAYCRLRIGEGNARCSGSWSLHFPRTAASNHAY